jgi:uncharacterized OsmC-like protein
MERGEGGELNGLRPQRLEAILDSLQQPETLAAVSGPWKARVVWRQGFRTQSYAREHRIDMDEPAGLDASDLAASAHEHLLAAIGSCLAVGFILNATRQGIAVQQLEVAVEASFDNILKWAGQSATGNPGYRQIRAELRVVADANRSTIEQLWKLAQEGSPVTQSVMRGTPVVATVA